MSALLCPREKVRAHLCVSKERERTVHSEVPYELLIQTGTFIYYCRVDKAGKWDSILIFFREDFVPEDETSYIPFHISLAQSRPTIWR